MLTESNPSTPPAAGSETVGATVVARAVQGPVSLDELERTILFCYEQLVSCAYNASHLAWTPMMFEVALRQCVDPCTTQLTWAGRIDCLINASKELQGVCLSEQDAVALSHTSLVLLKHKLRLALPSNEVQS